MRHFPTRKVLFIINTYITFHMLNVLIGLLLDKILEMFVEFEKEETNMRSCKKVIEKQ